MGAWAGGDVGGADLGGDWAAGVCLLCSALVVGCSHNRRLRAVGDAFEGAGEAVGHGEVEVAQELIAVIAIELQGEGGVIAGQWVQGACGQTRVEGAGLPWAGRAAGTGGEPEEGA